MSLTLNWTDRNITVDKFRIYRANTVILDGALPVVLAEVPAGTFTYTDATAVRNQLYHYRVGVVQGTEETLSTNMPLAYMPYTGPGPQKLLRGDWGLGTFGRMPAEDLFGAAELISLVNAPGLPLPPSNATVTAWLKIVYNGKIMFIPDRSVSQGLSVWSWAELYKAGLVYGTDDPSTWSAAAKSTYGVVPQAMTILKGSDSFIVRLPGTRVGALTGSAVPANQIGGEYDFVMAPNYQNRAQSFGGPSLDDLVHATTVENAFTKDVTATDGGTCILRGPNGTAIPDGVITTPIGNNSAVWGFWRPILELVL